MDKEEREKRREIKHDLKEKERAKFIASLPASRSDLQDLLDFVGNLEEPCDHTLKDSLAFIQERGLPESEVIAWLRENGGHCDCEVAFNVEDRWIEIFGEE